MRRCVVDNITTGTSRAKRIPRDNIGLRARRRNRCGAVRTAAQDAASSRRGRQRFPRQLAPGDPFTNMDENRACLRGTRAAARGGLDRPNPEQYALYLRNLARGDLDGLLAEPPRRRRIPTRCPITLLLMGLALFGRFVLGVTAGFIRAVVVDRWATARYARARWSSIRCRLARHNGDAELGMAAVSPAG